MKGSIGCPARIVTRIPRWRELGRGGAELSAKAKFRLKVLDYYYLQSPRYSQNGRPEAKLTCRHFGIHRSMFYRWKARYDKYNLSTLENKPSAPKKKREPEYSRDLVRAVREIRKANPTYSGKKIKPILERTRDDVPSAATIGRLIARENLFFRADVKRRKKHSNAALKAHSRKRKPANLKAEAARTIVEFDMKHVYLLGKKYYAFCAIDPYTKETLIHASSSSSSVSAKAALKKAIARFGKGVMIVNDNGSENMKDAEAYLREQTVTQYWARPHTPKDKPFVERFIGTFQKECLDYHYEPMTVRELQEIADAWLDTYHFYRPHASLNFLTPAEFCARLEKPILLQRVSYM